MQSPSVRATNTRQLLAPRSIAAQATVAVLPLGSARILRSSRRPYARRRPPTFGFRTPGHLAGREFQGATPANVAPGPLERGPQKWNARLTLPRALHIDDLRLRAKRRLPRVVFDYVDGGADGETTLRENTRAFQDVTFRPRQAVALPSYDLGTRVLGWDLSFPAVLAPLGYPRLL